MAQRPVFLLLFLISAVTCQSQMHPVEACWDSVFSLYGQEYGPAFERLEASALELIDLSEASPEGYGNFLVCLEEQNEFVHRDIDIHPLFRDGFETCFVKHPRSLSDSLSIRLTQMQHRLSRVRGTSVKNAHQHAAEVFSTTDLEQRIVRHYLLTFYGLPVEYGVFPALPTLPNKVDPSWSYYTTPARNLLRIAVGPEGELTVNGREVHYRELANVVYRHIADTSGIEGRPELEHRMVKGVGKRAISKQFIAVYASSETPQRMYHYVMERVSQAFEQRRNELAVHELGEPYSRMLNDTRGNQTRIETVVKLLPYRVVEHEF